MKILTHFQHINLTDDQKMALEEMHAFLEGDERVFVLKGYAGSGKTTLLKGLVSHLKSLEKKYQLMAPTGRAAKVINQKTGFETSTIHKGIYSFDELEELKIGADEQDVSFLYQFKIRNNIEVHNSILIVDESSMLSDVLSQGEFFRFGSGHLLRDLIDYARIQEPTTTSKIIFVGDPAQLPPIGMNFSPALDEKYLQDRYGLKVKQVEMKAVKRQDENNGILLAANRIRRSLTSGYFNDFDLRENEKDIFNPRYADFLETYKSLEEKKIVVCYTNKTALDLNREIRIDKFGDDLPIQSSDIVIIGVNNYRLGIMNGEFAVVSEANSSSETREVSFYMKGNKTERVQLTWRKISLTIPDENSQSKTVSAYMLENYLFGDNFLKPEEQRALYIDFKNRHPNLKKGTKEFNEALIKDPYFNCIQLKYGYAVTCHKAQGGEWNNALVFWDRGVKQDFNFLNDAQDASSKKNADFYRWAYTAVTRASDKLFCINPPRFSSFSDMRYIEVNVQKAFKELSGNHKSEISLDLDHEILGILEDFNLQDAPQSFQDHFIKHWFVLDLHNIDIVSWEKVQYEIRYIFKKGEETAAFKFWINAKNEFRPNFMKLPNQTNSNDLYDEINLILSKAPEIVINRRNSTAILQQIAFDIDIEEEKPFLKKLFDELTHRLQPGISVTKIDHLPYKERYTFEENGSQCVVDFEYNQDGFFGRVLPLEKKSQSAKILDSIDHIIITLKSA